jgi:arginine-tRNA-protein transferase
MPSSSTIYENIIDEAIEMQPVHPAYFDQLMAEGWRLLGHSIIRHNYAVCRGALCRTIPLRINLAKFQWSKSQRQLLRRSRSEMDIQVGPIVIDATRERLFKKHTQRFRERQPTDLSSFIGSNAGTHPVMGREFSVYLNGRLAGCSYMHVGAQTMSGTYCFFNPDLHRFSLGTVTMLREIELALELGLQYYHHGYCYDVPSQFDYKLNFHGLESLNWETLEWTPTPRVPTRQWENLV